MKDAEQSATEIHVHLALFRPHRLHAEERHWPETNCYNDLWINLLNGTGLDPLAGLGFTAELAYEGDQFTFGKYQSDSLDRLYGLHVRELILFGDVAGHVETQVRQERVVLMEVDGYHLPDTNGVSYRRSHDKTTIGIRYIDPDRQQLGYYHNSGFYLLESQDYRHVFTVPADTLPPYAEMVGARREALKGSALLSASLECLGRHVARMPTANPIAAWRAVFPAHFDALIEAPQGAFHAYAFHHPRQLGSNFELLASHIEWLKEQGGFAGTAAVPATAIAEHAKTLQFRLARAVARGRIDPCDDLMDALEDNYAQVAGALHREMA